MRISDWSSDVCSSDLAVNRKRAAGWRQYSDMMSPMPAGYHRLKDGDRIDIGGRRWRIAVGSGHSPEHACLVPEDGTLMISGDQVLPRISSNVSVYAAEPLADPLGAWLASIERFNKLPPDRSEERRVGKERVSTGR